MDNSLFKKVDNEVHSTIYYDARSKLFGMNTRGFVFSFVIQEMRENVNPHVKIAQSFLYGYKDRIIIE